MNRHRTQTAPALPRPALPPAPHTHASPASALLHRRPFTHAPARLAPARPHPHAQVGTAAYNHTSTPCNPGVVGSVAACFNNGIKAENNVDYPWGAPEIAYPTTGAPWGIHITGPYPDGRTYLISWWGGVGWGEVRVG